MRHYHIASNGTKHGPFAEDEIAAMVAAGRFQKTDLCWTEGMSDWAPLESVALVLPALPPPLPSSGGTRGSSGSAPWFLYIPASRLIVMSLHGVAMAA